MVVKIWVTVLLLGSRPYFVDISLLSRTSVTLIKDLVFKCFPCPFSFLFSSSFLLPLFNSSNKVGGVYDLNSRKTCKYNGSLSRSPCSSPGVNVYVIFETKLTQVSGSHMGQSISPKKYN